MQKIKEKSQVTKSEGFRPFEGGNCGKGGGRVLGLGEMHYRVQNWVSRPNVDDFWHPIWTYLNVRKMREIIFPPLWFLIQKLDHNSGLHAKNQREIFKNEVRRPPPPHPHALCGNVDIPFWNGVKKNSIENTWFLLSGESLFSGDQTVFSQH